jgi:hypothetical protein
MATDEKWNRPRRTFKLLLIGEIFFLRGRQPERNGRQKTAGWIGEISDWKKKDWQGLITQFANGQFFSLSSLVNKMKMYIFCPSFQYVLALSNSRLPYSFNGSYS